MPDIADTSDSSYVIVSSGGPEANLPNKRTLSAGNNVAITDAGAGSTATIAEGTQSIAYTGVISPTQITSDQNDYNPTNLSTSSVIRLDSDSSFRTITGLSGGSSGRIMILYNISANTILLANQNTGSSAGNRFDFGGYDFPLFPSHVIKLIYDNTSSRWRLVGGSNFVSPSARNGFYWMGHFLSGTGEGGTATAASGGTASVIATVAGHNGILEFTTGTSGTGTASHRSGNSLNLLGNNWYMRFDYVLKLVRLSDATHNYTMRIGFIDSGTTEPTDGCYFRYNHSVNSGKWQKVSRNNNTETGSANDTGSTADTNWHRFTVIVNPAGNNVEYFIDGVSVGTETTNIPTGAGRVVGWGMNFVKTAGTSDVTLVDIDSIEVVGYSNVIL